ncbi:MAG: hypothetical protein GY801_17975 [bacterium]|nr:hypothetical protein [bacterium]
MIHRFFAYREKQSIIRVFLSILGVALLSFVLLSCAGQGTRFSKPLPLVEEDMQAKALIPGPGKSLVYFYYGRYPTQKGTVIALDSAASDIKKDTYLVWETDPGKHEFEVTFYKMMSKDHFKGNIETEAGQTHFYHLFMEEDSVSSSSFDTHSARFLEAKKETGRKKIANNSLMAWFRDGEVIFRREIEATPESPRTLAETPEAVATPEPEAPVEITQELTPVPDVAPEETAATPEIAPVPALEESVDAAEKSAESTLAVQGRFYALVIGISEYEHLKMLPSAVNDAQAVADALQDYGFKVNTLFDKKASRERILDSLEVFQRLLEPEDKLLLYYAGHGVLDSDGQNAYWQPTEAKEDSMTQWIPADSVTATLKRMPAGQILVVTDSVYTGTLMRASHADLKDDAARQRYLKKIAEKRSRVILTGGAARPSVVMSESGLSLFASAFVNGLREIDRSVFATEELFQEQILEVVAGQSEQLPEFQVIRNSGHEGGDFIFVRE